jgi:V8-like Glu-specific endopeptidase
MKKLMCLALILAVMAPVTVSAQSHPPSTGSDEISRDFTGGPETLPDARPVPLPDVNEVDRALLGIDDFEAAAQGLATVTRTSDGETIVTPPTEQMRSLFLEHLANPGPTAAIGGSLSLPPTDDRIRVSDSSALPERAVGLLRVTFEHSGTGTCAGTLIGPSTVLTAAHCVYDRDDRRWAKDVAFHPGLTSRDDMSDGAYQWESAALIEAYVVDAGGTGGSAVDWDLAVVTLREPAGNVAGWLDIAADEPEAFTARVYDYPADKPEATMWYDDCEIRAEQRHGNVVLHRCSIAGAGGPVLEMDDGTARVRAVNVAADTTATYAVRLNDAYYAWLIAAID